MQRCQVRNPSPEDAEWISQWRPVMVGAPPLRWETTEKGWNACVYVAAPGSLTLGPGGRDGVRITLAAITKKAKGCWLIEPRQEWIPEWAGRPMRIAQSAIVAFERYWAGDEETTPIHGDRPPPICYA